MSFLSVPTSAAETGNSSIGDHILVVDGAGQLRAVEVLRAAVDSMNRTVSISVADSKPGGLEVLIADSWLRSLVPNPAFSNRGFVVKHRAGAKWFAVGIDDAIQERTVSIREFRPELGLSQYTLGSPYSIGLERPMFVSLEEVPRTEWVTETLSNANGTWTEERPVPILRMGISFTDVDATGQTVALNLSWLRSYGLSRPYFQYADGTQIANSTDALHAYLAPEHFSVLYVFTTSESFVKVSDQSYSDVWWNGFDRNIYILSDRRDPANTNERLQSTSTVAYDETSSFTIRAMWTATQQGNWQLAVPIFFMNSGNTRISMANSIHVIYASRGANVGQQPLFYLRFWDRDGVLRVNHLVEGIHWQVQLSFLIKWDGYTRVLTMAIYDNAGNLAGTPTGQVLYGLASGQGFTLHRIGAGAWGLSDTYEPRIVAQVDNVYFDANMARNGNYEFDSNADGVPDNWQAWIWSKGPVYRSSATAKQGGWSVRIQDSSTTNDYGLQTVRMAAGAGKGYVGTTWVYASPGSFTLCIEFWNSYSSGTRLAVGCKSSVYTYQWEFLDLTMTAPTGTVAIDLLVYSSGSNTGTGYFDISDLRLRRSFWSVNNHDGDAGTGLTGWITTFARAADLGVSHVRTDLRWNEFEPDRDGGWNQAEIDYWRSVIRAGNAHGVDLIVILNGPRPYWVTDSNVYQEFYEFCDKIAWEFGKEIYYYQILNEANTNQEVGGDFPQLISRCYSGLKSGEGVYDTSHKSAFKTIVNANVHEPNTFKAWDSKLVDWLSAAGTSIDIIAMDYYPGTWDSSSCSSWGPLDRLFELMIAYSKEGAITETGFSTWHVGTDYAAQETWVNCALPIIKTKAENHNRANPRVPLLFASWYELVDANTDIWFEFWPWIVLYHFGLMETNLNLKPAYDDFGSQVASYGF